MNQKWWELNACFWFFSYTHKNKVVLTSCFFSVTKKKHYRIWFFFLSCFLFCFVLGLLVSDNENQRSLFCLTHLISLVEAAKPKPTFWRVVFHFLPLGDVVVFDCFSQKNLNESTLPTCQRCCFFLLLFHNNVAVLHSAVSFSLFLSALSLLHYTSFFLFL